MSGLTRYSDSLQTSTISPQHRAMRSRQVDAGFKQTILDSISAQIAVLDRTGVIVAANEAWQRFAVESGVAPGYTSIGQNYQDACRQASGQSTNEIAKTADGFLAVLEGRLSSFSLDYPCVRGNTCVRTRLVHGARAVLSHAKALSSLTTQFRQYRPLNVAVVLLAHEQTYRPGFASQPA